MQKCDKTQISWKCSAKRKIKPRTFWEFENSATLAEAQNYANCLKMLSIEVAFNLKGLPPSLLLYLPCSLLSRSRLVYARVRFMAQKLKRNLCHV